MVFLDFGLRSLALFLIITFYFLAASINFFGSYYFVKFIIKLSKGQVINFNELIDDAFKLKESLVLTGIISTFVMICSISLYFGMTYMFEFLIIWCLLVWCLPFGINVLLKESFINRNKGE